MLNFLQILLHGVLFQICTVFNLICDARGIKGQSHACSKHLLATNSRAYFRIDSTIFVHNENLRQNPHHRKFVYLSRSKAMQEELWTGRQHAAGIWRWYGKHIHGFLHKLILGFCPSFIYCTIPFNFAHPTGILEAMSGSCSFPAALLMRRVQTSEGAANV